MLLQKPYESDVHENLHKHFNNFLAKENSYS